MKMQSSFLREVAFGLLIGCSHALAFGVKFGLRGSEVGHLVSHPNASVTVLQVTDAQDSVNVKAVHNRESERDRAAFEKRLVRSIMTSRLTIGSAIERGFADMTPDQAIRALEGKLPPEVSSLVHLTQDRKQRPSLVVSSPKSPWQRPGKSSMA